MVKRRNSWLIVRMEEGNASFVVCEVIVEIVVFEMKEEEWPSIVRKARGAIAIVIVIEIKEATPSIEKKKEEKKKDKKMAVSNPT
jgi:intracellular septation protein A